MFKLFFWSASSSSELEFASVLLHAEQQVLSELEPAVTDDFLFAFLVLLDNCVAFDCGIAAIFMRNPPVSELKQNISIIKQKNRFYKINYLVTLNCGPFVGVFVSASSELEELDSEESVDESESFKMDKQNIE